MNLAKAKKQFFYAGILLSFCLFSVQNVFAGLVFVTEENAVNSDNFILDFDDTATDFIDLDFGGTLLGQLRYDILNSKFSLNQDVDLSGNEIMNVRLENLSGAPTCDITALGRVYYDDALASSYVCEEVTPSVYNWVDLTIAASTSNTKVVTVGTGGNYPTLAAAATYLNALTGGIILLTPETHTVTTTVDVQNISVIGSNPEQSVVNVTGAGVLQVKDTIFRNMTIDVDSGITANSAMDVKYDATTTSSIVFDWVDVITGGSKTLLESTAGTAPTLITRFVSPSAKSGTATIVSNKAASGLNATTSVFTFSSQGGDGALDINDWDVSIAGSSHVLTTGTITTTPDNTIFAYPGMNLQQAVDSLSSGGILTLLPGIHGITSPLLITNNNITITGYGDASIIEATGFTGIGVTTAAINLGSVDGTAPVSDVSLRDFKLEVNNTDIHGIRASGGTDLKIFNVTVEKTAGTSGSAATAKLGILLMDGAATPLVRPVIKNSRIFGAPGRWFTDGIHVSGEGAVAGLFGNGNGVQNALVESSSVDFVGETAAAFVHVSDSSLFNNRFSNMGGAGGGAYGVYMGRISRTNMANNIVSGSLSTTSIAIGVESFNIGADPTTKDSVFSGNVIDGTANGGVGFGTGFQVGATAGTTVQNNIFELNSVLGASTATTTAFVARGNFDNNIFTSNTISGGTNTWNNGIDIQSAGAIENVIRGNMFTNVTTAISDSGTDTKLGVAQHQSTVNPTVNNDKGAGYTVGTIWVNQSANTSFISVDDTVGAAIWNQIDAAGGGHTQNTDTGTTSNTFTLDNDNTGGDINLTFGTTLNEILKWDNTNSRFALSDDFRVEGNLATVGQGFTAADHAAADSDGILNIGRNGSAWETLIFDATTDDRFELSDDLNVEGDIDFTGNLVSECGAYESYTLERGSIGNNQFMAFGNGRQTDGTPMGCAGTVTKVAAMCSGSIGTSLNYFLTKNGTNTTCTLNNATTSGVATIATCSEPFVGLDVMNIRTGTEVGAWTDCVVTFWVKYN